MTTEYKFDDGVAITYSQHTALIRDNNNDTIAASDENRPTFTNATGETVIEYPVPATDGQTPRSWAKAIVSPKGRSPVHRHYLGAEDYYVVAGTAKAILDNIEYNLAAGDHIRIDARRMHQVVNLDPTQDMVLYVKSEPTWTFEDHNLIDEKAIHHLSAVLDQVGIFKKLNTDGQVTGKDKHEVKFNLS